MKIRCENAVQRGGGRDGLRRGLRLPVLVEERQGFGYRLDLKKLGRRH